MIGQRIERVAVVAPAGLASTERIERGLDALSEYGVSAEFIAPGPAPRHYLAGDDAYRAEAIRRAWSMEVDALWALRGGFGCIRTLEALGEYTDRKPLFGFSDVSTLLAHAPVAWHAPVITQLPNLDTDSMDALAAVLAGDYHAIPFGAAPQVLAPGRATGRLVGGNLTVLGSLCGTRWQSDLRNGILIIEDVGEPPYRVDRVWTQLRLSGALRGVKGLLIGQFTGVAQGEQDTMMALFGEMASDIDGPVVTGLPIGHLSSNVPVPLGVQAELNTDPLQLQLRW